MRRAGVLPGCLLRGQAGDQQEPQAVRKAHWDGVCPAEGPTASGLLVTQLCILGKWRARTRGRQVPTGWGREEGHRGPVLRHTGRAEAGPEPSQSSRGEH